MVKTRMVKIVVFSMVRPQMEKIVKLMVKTMVKTTTIFTTEKLNGKFLKFYKNFLKLKKISPKFLKILKFLRISQIFHRNFSNIIKIR